MEEAGADRLVVAVKRDIRAWSEGAELFSGKERSTPQKTVEEELFMEMKPYDISKHVVWEAWKKVAANGGAPGVDGQTVEDFKRKLKDNLYKVWNRMSSGSYCPKAVRLCEIPKGDGKVRVLGIPTVEDRVAQMTAAMVLEPKVEAAWLD